MPTDALIEQRLSAVEAAVVELQAGRAQSRRQPTGSIGSPGPSRMSRPSPRSSSMAEPSARRTAARGGRVKYLLDTDHLRILQQQSGPEYAALAARLAAHPPADFGLSVVSFHEQVLGCHTYISRGAERAGPGPRLRHVGAAPERLRGGPRPAVRPAAASALPALSARRVRIATMD